MSRKITPPSAKYFSFRSRPRSWSRALLAKGFKVVVMPKAVDACGERDAAN